MSLYPKTCLLLQHGSQEGVFIKEGLQSGADCMDNFISPTQFLRPWLGLHADGCYADHNPTLPLHQFNSASHCTTCLYPLVNKEYLKHKRHVIAKTHDVTAKTHDVTAKTHDVIAKSHDVTAKTHDVTAKRHDVTAKTHDVTAKTHDVTAKTHDVTAKTHDVTAKTHDVIAI